MKTCPRCNLDCYEIAHRCECGYDFMTSKMGSPSGLSYKHGKRDRTILAFLVAPLAGPMGIFIGVVLLELLNDNIPTQERLDSLEVFLFFLFIFGTPIIYFFSMVLGVPMYLLLKALNCLNRPALMFGWSIVGMLSLLIFADRWYTNDKSVFLSFIPFALGGCFIGFFFWAILSRDKR